MKKLLFAIIFIMSAMAFNCFASEVPDFVRVGINSSSLTGSVTIESDGGVYTEAFFAIPEDGAEESPFFIADKVEVTVSENGTLICNGEETDETEVDFLKTSEFIVCQGKKYRGAIRLKVKSGKILIISVLSLDEYLYGVVGREMSESFPLEALKAQSVAARNYTVISMNRHGSEGFDLCNGIHCQAYGGVAAEGSNIRKAVDETSGKLLLYKGRVVECYYYSSNGGYSESSENVWMAELGYLKGKADPYEDPERTPSYRWEVKFTADQIKENLASRGIDIGDIQNIEVTKVSENHHVLEIKITGSKGDKYYYKDNIRAAFPSGIKSTYFTVTGGGKTEAKVLSSKGLESVTMEPCYVLTSDGKKKLSGKANSGEFIFSGGGNGHSVGMSQYGAMFMAEEGFTYDEILNFYYTDTEISE
ncbi:MAG: SpoIID/LytB domain-containing protein [Clostridia bacterium]|nr:SpoIID/LytB domain-containing protein [Clostridia bacterium]